MVDEALQQMGHAVIRQAIKEGKTVELMENILKGGSATISAATGELVLFTPDHIQQLMATCEQEEPITISMPPWFEDDEPCGYCDRPIGEKHKSSCRQ